MRCLLLSAVVLLLLAPAAVMAQMMGPEMGMMGMGMPASPMDIDPIWSPDGKWIAFTRTTATQGAVGPVEAGLISAEGGEVKLTKNLRPLCWTPDSAGIICGLSAAAGQTSPYSGFWKMDAARPNRITLIIRAVDPQFAAYSPDGKKLLLLDLVGKDRHEILVGNADATPAVFYSTRGSDKIINAGWADGSNAVWMVLEVPAKDALEPGAQIPKEALKATQMMGMGMMGPEMGMMGGTPGMMGPEMGMGMMMGAPVATSKRILCVMPLDRSSLKKIGDDVENASWNPKQPLLVLHRKVTTTAPGGGGMPGGMPGMMPSGMPGMMGPEMGMMGMMGMGAATTTDEFMAFRKPDEPATAEERIGNFTMGGMVWSSDGKMVAGASAAEKRVFAIKAPGGLVYEISQDLDDNIKAPGHTAVAWSPDGKKAVFPAMTQRSENNEQFVIRGLVIRDMESAEAKQLTEHKTKAMMGGIMGMPGMMGMP